MIDDVRKGYLRDVHLVDTVIAIDRFLNPEGLVEFEVASGSSRVALTNYNSLSLALRAGTAKSRKTRIFEGSIPRAAWIR